MTTGDQVVAEARKLLGDPYVYGAEGPSKFDCSGLVEFVFNKAGLNVPRVSSAQYKFGKAISVYELTPGDLVFSEWPGDDVPAHGHVAIYAGDGKIIEAPHPGGVVQEVHLDSNYLAHVDGLTRPVGLDTGSTPPTVGDGNLNGGIPVGPGIAAAPANSGFDWNPTSWAGNLANWLTGGIAGDVKQLISATTSTLAETVKFFGLFFQPSTYIRIGAGLLGFSLLFFGLILLSVEAFTSA